MLIKIEDHWINPAIVSAVTWKELNWNRQSGTVAIAVGGQVVELKHGPAAKLEKTAKTIKAAQRASLEELAIAIKAQKESTW